MLVGILKKLVGIMIGPVGILKNACRYFETVGIMNVGIMNVGIMNATRFALITSRIVITKPHKLTM